MKNITIEELHKIIKDVTTDTFKTNNKEIVIGQGCLTNGFVMRSLSNLNICTNPNCTSCRAWHKELIDMTTKELKSLSLTPYIPAPLENERTN
jgi:hypothetical protein